MKTVASKQKKTRRGRYEGSVYEREDGRWSGSVSLGVDEFGKRRRKTFYGDSKTDVLDQIRNFVPSAQEVSEKRIRFSDYLDAWLAGKKLTTEKRTHEYYEMLARLHIKPRLGHLWMSDISAKTVRSFYSKLLDKEEGDGLSVALVRKVGTALVVALNDAVPEVLAFNPATAVKKPKKQHTEAPVFGEEQAKLFLAFAWTSRDWPFYVTMIDTGLRPGELWALRWSDVNLTTGELQVRRSLERPNDGVLCEKAAKTDKSRRRVVLAPQTVNALTELHVQRQAAAGDLVFPNCRGGFMRFQNFRRDSYLPLLKRAGLPEVPMYTLRHTSATLLLLLDVPAKVVSERLGHSTTRLTLDTYSHVLPTMQKEVASKLGGLLDKLLPSRENASSEENGCQNGCHDDFLGCPD